jgi:hypothetical protein
MAKTCDVCKYWAGGESKAVNSLKGKRGKKPFLIWLCNKHKNFFKFCKTPDDLIVAFDGLVNGCHC